jgi:hypothetical protein
LRQPKIPIILGSIILPIGVGFLAQALYDNNQGHVKAWLIVSGAGVGLGFGPLCTSSHQPSLIIPVLTFVIRSKRTAFQARYSQPEDRIAIVVATNLFFRSFGGTIGLAQLSAVMYSRVRSYIANQVTSGSITGEQALQISAALSSVDASGGGIFSLPQSLQDVVTSAFRDGLRLAFFSLLPWLGIAFVLNLFLSRIPEERMSAKPGQQLEQNVEEVEK